MSFAAPEWFFLLAVFLFAGWFWPRLQLWRPLRALALLVLVVLLADPQLQRNQNSLDLWVLLEGFGVLLAAPPALPVAARSGGGG